jgi:hypothetical protein
MAKFKQEVIERIESDSDLFSAVAKALDIKPTSLPQTLKRNGNTLNQYKVVMVVANHMRVQPEELLEEETTETTTK